MKRLLIPFLLFCLFATLFTGCVTDTKSASLCAVVTEAEITCQHKDVQIHRYYTDTTKLQWVLLYLRLLRPMGRPEIDPDSVDADVYQISLGFSDGTRRIYRQKDHRYLSVDFAPWKKIDSGTAAGLYTILRKVPSDPQTNFAKS